MVYGQKGTGSVPVEATLLLLGERSPRRPRLHREAPKVAEVVRHLDQDARLAEFRAERFR